MTRAPRAAIVVGSACSGQGFQFAPDTGEKLARLAGEVAPVAPEPAGSARCAERGLDECLSIRDGRLFVEGRARRELADSRSARRST